MDAKTFTTPLRKLARFFQRSRDGWKAKCQEAKRACKKSYVDLCKERQNPDACSPSGAFLDELY